MKTNYRSMRKRIMLAFAFALCCLFSAVFVGKSSEAAKLKLWTSKLTCKIGTKHYIGSNNGNVIKVVSVSNKKVVKASKASKASGYSGDLCIESKKKGKATVKVKLRSYNKKKTSVFKLKVTVKDYKAPKLKNVENGGTLDKQWGISEFTPIASSDDDDDEYDLVNESEYEEGDVGIDADYNAKSFSVTSSDESVATAKIYPNDDMSGGEGAAGYSGGQIYIRPKKSGTVEFTATVNLKYKVAGKKKYTFSFTVNIIKGCGLTAPDGSFTPIEDFAYIYTNGLLTCNSDFEEPEDITKLVGELTIPKGVTVLGERAFYNATGITKVTLPDTVKTIGESAFSGCTSLEQIEIPDGVTTISKLAFQNTGITSLRVPSTVKTIGNNAFDGISTVYYSGSANGSPWGAGEIVS